MLNSIGCVIPPEGGIYCSAPITSGRRFIGWAKRLGVEGDIDSADPAHKSSHLAEVMRPNAEHAKQIVQRLRTDFPNPVIDPTVLNGVPDWTQADWQRFWEEVITRFASRVVFL